jgi:hypothetical protein
MSNMKILFVMVVCKTECATIVIRSVQLAIMKKLVAQELQIDNVNPVHLLVHLDTMNHNHVHQQQIVFAHHVLLVM